MKQGARIALQVLLFATLALALTTARAVAATPSDGVLELTVPEQTDTIVGGQSDEELYGDETSEIEVMGDVYLAGFTMQAASAPIAQVCSSIFVISQVLQGYGSEYAAIAQALSRLCGGFGAVVNIFVPWVTNVYQGIQNQYIQCLQNYPVEYCGQVIRPAR